MNPFVYRVEMRTLHAVSRLCRGCSSSHHNLHYGSAFSPQSPVPRVFGIYAAFDHSRNENEPPKDNRLNSSDSSAQWSHIGQSLCKFQTLIGVNSGQRISVLPPFSLRSDHQLFFARG